MKHFTGLVMVAFVIFCGCVSQEKLNAERDRILAELYSYESHYLNVIETSSPSEEWLVLELETLKELYDSAYEEFINDSAHFLKGYRKICLLRADFEQIKDDDVNVAREQLKQIRAHYIAEMSVVKRLATLEQCIVFNELLCAKEQKIEQLYWDQCYSARKQEYYTIIRNCEDGDYQKWRDALHALPPFPTELPHMAVAPYDDATARREVLQAIDIADYAKRFESQKQLIAEVIKLQDQLLLDDAEQLLATFKIEADVPEWVVPPHDQEKLLADAKHALSAKQKQEARRKEREVWETHIANLKQLLKEGKFKDARQVIESEPRLSNEAYRTDALNTILFIEIYTFAEKNYLKRNYTVARNQLLSLTHNGDSEILDSLGLDFDKNVLLTKIDTDEGAFVASRLATDVNNYLSEQRFNEAYTAVTSLPVSAFPDVEAIVADQKELCLATIKADYSKYIMVCVEAILKKALETSAYETAFIELDQVLIVETASFPFGSIIVNSEIERARKTITEANIRALEDAFIPVRDSFKNGGLEQSVKWLENKPTSISADVQRTIKRLEEEIFFYLTQQIQREINEIEALKGQDELQTAYDVIIKLNNNLTALPQVISTNEFIEECKIYCAQTKVTLSRQQHQKAMGIFVQFFGVLGILGIGACINGIRKKVFLWNTRADLFVSFAISFVFWWGTAKTFTYFASLDEIEFPFVPILAMMLSYLTHFVFMYNVPYNRVVGPITVFNLVPWRLFLIFFTIGAIFGYLLKFVLSILWGILSSLAPSKEEQLAEAQRDLEYAYGRDGRFHSQQTKQEVINAIKRVNAIECSSDKLELGCLRKLLDLFLLPFVLTTRSLSLARANMHDD